MQSTLQMNRFALSFKHRFYLFLPQKPAMKNIIHSAFPWMVSKRLMPITAVASAWGDENHSFLGCRFIEKFIQIYSKSCSNSEVIMSRVSSYFLKLQSKNAKYIADHLCGYSR
jgi:hypothetical protein